jgi:hypothetical protein
MSAVTRHAIVIERRLPPLGRPHPIERDDYELRLLGELAMPRLRAPFIPYTLWMRSEPR